MGSNTRPIIEQAQALNEHEPTVTWNVALFNLLLKEQAEQARSGPYPLLENIFFGNYEASLEVMRSYHPEGIFSRPTPLLIGSVAESGEQALSEWILDLTNQAIEVEPELAAAYFCAAGLNFWWNRPSRMCWSMSSAPPNSILRMRRSPAAWNI